MQSLPDGPIILCGHSMGGLLVAEAATNNSPASRRVIGVLAFDAPFLGMHPHVVFSGIASLFSKGGDKPPRTKHDNKSIEEKAKPAPSAEGMALETALNDQEAVTFVSSTEAYPKGSNNPNVLFLLTHNAQRVNLQQPLLAPIQAAYTSASLPLALSLPY